MLPSKTYKIKNLNLDIIRPSFSTMDNVALGGSKIVVIGKPSSGKSFLIRDLIYRKSDIFPTCMVMNGTEAYTHAYEQAGIPSCFIYNTLNKERLESFMERQKLAREHLTNPWSLLVIDDCMEDPKLWNDPVFGALVKNGRQMAMTMIIGLQYCMDIKPTIRSNFDGCFIFREPSLQTRKKLYDTFASIIPDFSDFCALMDTMTNDHTALYINNSEASSNDLEDCVFWYKAKPIPKDFKFGCKEIWSFNEERLKEELLMGGKGNGNEDDDM